MPPLQDLPLPSSFDSSLQYVSELVHFTASSETFQVIVGGVHILDFFTRSPDLYDWLLCEEWRQWFDLHDIDEILDFILRDDTFSSPASQEMPDWRGKPRPPRSLVDYVHRVRSLLLDRSFPARSQTGSLSEPSRPIPRSIAVGMKPKKLHEVGHFAQYVHELTESLAVDEQKTTHLVDFGSGQNYLGRTLASPLYNQNVIAVEGRHINVESARRMDTGAKLAPKYCVYWDKKTRLLSKQDIIIKPGLLDQEHHSGSIQYIERELHDGNLSSVLEQAVHVKEPTKLDGHSETHGVLAVPLSTKRSALVTVSLHSCGNLSHHGLRSLTLNPSVHAIAIVGCCYNLVTERLTAPTYKMPSLRLLRDSNSPSCERSVTDGDPHGFPMSARLCNLQPPLYLNITARMMACQAPQNWTKEESDGFFQRHFYRALLQRVFLDRGLIEPPELPMANNGDSQDKRSFAERAAEAGGSAQPIMIGSLRKSCYVSFIAYVRGVVEKLGRGAENHGLSLTSISDMTDDEIQAYEDMYLHRKKHLSVVWTLMAYSAGLVEALIVVDRWLWLKEQPKVASAWVEAVFDYKKSPRNLVVVGTKSKS